MVSQVYKKSASRIPPPVTINNLRPISNRLPTRVLTDVAKSSDITSFMVHAAFKKNRVFLPRVPSNSPYNNDPRMFNPEVEHKSKLPKKMKPVIDRSCRRILNFPAVHPCEDVSTVTILQSLIFLSRSICNTNFKYLVTQRRNSREVIRQIGILLIFFQEIQERGSNLPNKIVLCFCELHHVFQKLKFLLDDCAREDSRIWILLKSHFVASQFRVLIRSVATALDVLPLDTIRVSTEVREIVKMVTAQARKAKLDLDPDDENTMKRVLVILNQFENRFEPDPSLIKPVLDYLSIRTWTECNNEIKFLEKEISFQCLDGNEREVPLMSSLVGFLSYCRGILFDDPNFDRADRSEGRSNPDLITFLNPDDFRCPISLELMTDPVTVSTGQTYDRASIQKWLKAGNLICPKTGEKLKTTEVVSNSTLQKLIHQFLADNGVSIDKSFKNNRDISRTILPGSQAAEQSIRFLAQFLARKLDNGTDEEKNKAAYEVRLLGKSNIFHRSCLIEADTIQPLLKLLSSSNASTQENAIAGLLKLSKHSSGKKMIYLSNGFQLIVAVLQEGRNLEARRIAAATIFYLSSVHNFRRIIGAETSCISALVELMKTTNTFAKKNAVAAIFGLLLSQRNHKKVLEAGTVPLLANIIATSDKVDLITDSLAVLATLAERIEGSDAVIKDLALITRTFRSITSSTGKEYCVSILLSLCNNCGSQVISVLANDGSIMALLYAILTDGNPHAVKSARSLIKIIHKSQEASYSSLTRNYGV